MTCPERRIKTVLFDLDGTLADTAPDLANALNMLRSEKGLGLLPYELIRDQVSHGSNALIRLGFDIESGSDEFPGLRDRLLDLYKANLALETSLFPGIEAVLETLKRKGLSWGVVTNKPAWLTDPLMQDLGLTDLAVCIVSGDSTANYKPHPEPLLHAARLADSHPAQCLYIGDASRDIEAGRAAGMLTLVALFGYIGPEDKPELWGADGVVEQPAHILEWLGDA
jgi:phosphoglycolate phosphatase